MASLNHGDDVLLVTAAVFTPKACVKCCFSEGWLIPATVSELQSPLSSLNHTGFLYDPVQWWIRNREKESFVAMASLITDLMTVNHLSLILWKCAGERI